MDSEDTADMGQALNSVRERVRRIALGSGRKPEEIRLIAVSKKQPLTKIEHLADQGHSWFGENYAQELAEKAAALLHRRLQWSYLGQLQSNKIRMVVRWASEIHSVGSLRHASLIQKFAEEFGKTPFPVFILVNLGREPQKSGISPEDLAGLREKITSGLKGLRLMGIMTIPPLTQSLHAEKGQISDLYKTARILASATGAGLLSLGMSHDLEASIICGSDIVRIGTDLFGPRPD